MYLQKPWINKYCNDELDKIILKFGNYQFNEEIQFESIEEFVRFELKKSMKFRAQIIKVSIWF